jgi:hypothetical protein
MQRSYPLGPHYDQIVIDFCPECEKIVKEILMIEQLQQLCTVTWDGNLISKTHRDNLVAAGYAERQNGYNVITANGLLVLHNLNLLPKGVRA